MTQRILLMLALAMILAACSSPAMPTIAPSPTSVLATATLTPVPTSTATSTLMPTITPTPTPFVTPPASGESAIVPILMYHNLRDLPAGASELDRTWTVAPKNFEAQVEWLSAHGFHTISMGQLVAHLNRKSPLPTKPIVISFDDGWVEQYTVAFPILRKRNFIGTFFVYTNPVGRNHYLSWEQLKEMTLTGMDIQAHTITHPHLRTIAASEAQREISESKKTLESKLGKPVVALSYPFGEYNAAIIEMTKRAGLESAVTLATGYRQRADELFTLHRIRVSYDDTLDEFAKRLPQ
jgi:peptidoglycan/xylan/chitin deacetylase (PgdA/CDA1 family)